MKISEITDDIEVDLHKLTLKPNGSYMRHILNYRQMWYKNVPIVIVHNDRNNIIAWGLRREKQVMVYVKPYYRRRGIGSQIVKEIRKKTRSQKTRSQLWGDPWSVRSEAFFDNVGL